MVTWPVCSVSANKVSMIGVSTSTAQSISGSTIMHVCPLDRAALGRGDSVVETQPLFECLLLIQSGHLALGAESAFLSDDVQEGQDRAARAAAIAESRQAYHRRRSLR